MKFMSFLFLSAIVIFSAFSSTGPQKDAGTPRLLLGEVHDKAECGLKGRITVDKDPATGEIRVVTRGKKGKQCHWDRQSYLIFFSNPGTGDAFMSSGDYPFNVYEEIIKEGWRYTHFEIKLDVFDIRLEKSNISERHKVSLSLEKDY